MTHTKQLYKQKLQNAWENLTNSIARHYVPLMWYSSSPEKPMGCQRDLSVNCRVGAWSLSVHDGVIFSPQNMKELNNVISALSSLRQTCFARIHSQNNGFPADLGQEQAQGKTGECGVFIWACVKRIRNIKTDFILAEQLSTARKPFAKMWFMTDVHLDRTQLCLILCIIWSYFQCQRRVWRELRH